MRCGYICCGGRTAVSDAMASFDARLVLQLAGYTVGAGDLVEEPALAY
jgi:hypothetical protein